MKPSLPCMGQGSSHIHRTEQWNITAQCHYLNNVARLHHCFITLDKCLNTLRVNSGSVSENLHRAITGTLTGETKRLVIVHLLYVVLKLFIIWAAVGFQPTVGWNKNKREYFVWYSATITLNHEALRLADSKSIAFSLICFIYIYLLKMIV